MIRWLTRKLAERHRCRNTRLTIFGEKAEGHGPQVIIEITDKCTGATYQAAFTLATAQRVQETLAEAIDRAAEMGAP